MSPSPRILIIRLSSLGDILHALPAFAGLRASFPNAKLDWVVERRAKSLLSAVRGISELHVLDTNTLRETPFDRSAWRRLQSLILELRARHYDFSIDFQGLLKTAFLGLSSGAQTRLGFSKALVREYPAHWLYHRRLPEPDRQIHVIALNQLLVEMINAPLVSTTFDFLVPEEDLRFVDSMLRTNRLTDFVAINPGGGWPTKRWSPERYGALAEKIQAEGLPVVVITGPGEEQLYRIIKEHSGRRIPHHFHVSFLQLIPLLRRARLLISGDTGPFHLACALGTAVVGIFGPTSPVRNGPWKHEDEVVTRILPCSFCNRRSCPEIRCMDITVDEVLASVVRRL